MSDPGSEYWTLANAITAFAVAQSLGFTYAVAQHQRIKLLKGIVIGAIGAGIVLFCVAVWLCNYAQTTLLQTQPPKASSSTMTPEASASFAAANPAAPSSGFEAKSRVLWWTMIGRMVAIILYGGFAITILWFAKKPELEAAA